MNLITETALISGTIIVLCGLPIFFERIRSQSRRFFLLGTGALSGILIFDLLPDLVEMGGPSSIWVMGLVWLSYSLVHLYHIRQHQKRPDHSEDAPHTESSLLFLGSMVAHCVTSGMLLALSAAMASEINKTVFFAILAHKGYEALTVSSILMERLKSKLAFISSVTAYALALPLGVLLTTLFQSMITQTVAWVIASLAIGTLFGCLIFDFLIPSFLQIRNRRRNLAWIIMGLIMSQAVLRAF